MHGFNVENEGEKMKRFRFEEAQRQKREQEEREREQKFLEAEILLEEERKRQERLKQERIEEIRRVRYSAASMLDAAAAASSLDEDESEGQGGGAAAVTAAATWSTGDTQRDVDGSEKEEEDDENESKGQPYHSSYSRISEADEDDQEQPAPEQHKTENGLRGAEAMSGAGTAAAKVVSQAEGYRAMLWVAQYASHLAAEGDSRGWFYLDEQSTVQGPFSSEDMASWSSQSYLDSDLLIRWVTGETYVRLGVLFPDSSTAFSADEVVKCLSNARNALKQLL